jgi:hypothetical protein
MRKPDTEWRGVSGEEIMTRISWQEFAARIPRRDVVLAGPGETELALRIEPVMQSWETEGMLDQEYVARRAEQQREMEARLRFMAESKVAVICEAHAEMAAWMLWSGCDVIPPMSVPRQRYAWIVVVWLPRTETEREWLERTIETYKTRSGEVYRLS